MQIHTYIKPCKYLHTTTYIYIEQRYTDTYKPKLYIYRQTKSYTDTDKPKAIQIPTNKSYTDTNIQKATQIQTL
jgi:hypothetical protein